MKKKKLIICVQCHNFQRRFAWMLSSIREASYHNEVMVDVACTPDNGDPTAVELSEFFVDEKYGLEIDHIFCKKEALQYRGYTRNAHLKLSGNRAEWMLFADCDMVYHPSFFANLFDELDKNHKDAPYILTAGRMSNPIDQANKLVNDSYDPKSYFQMNAFKRANELDLIRRSNVGAGFFQLINLEHCPHDGYYVENTRDYGWYEGKKMAKAKSDMQFRRRISKINPKVKLPKWFSENQIHLNHERDNQHGTHLEEQR